MGVSKGVWFVPTFLFEKLATMMLPLIFYFKRSRNTDSTGDSDDCGPAAPSKLRIELDLTKTQKKKCPVGRPRKLAIYPYSLQAHQVS